MTTLLFTHHGVSAAIQHKCHAVFCTPDYGLGRVKDLLHPVPSCIIELLLPPACLVLHSGHILSAGLLSIILLMIQHMGDGRPLQSALHSPDCANLHRPDDPSIKCVPRLHTSNHVSRPCRRLMQILHKDTLRSSVYQQITQKTDMYCNMQRCLRLFPVRCTQGVRPSAVNRLRKGL